MSIRRKLPHVRPLTGNASRRGGRRHRVGPHHGHGRPQRQRPGGRGIDAPLPGYAGHRRHHRHRRGRARRSAHAVHRRARGRCLQRRDDDGGYRGRSAGGHQSVRHRRGGRHHGAGGQRARRPAARAGLLHGEDRRGSGREGRGGPGRAGEAESESHRAAPGARRGRSGGGGARPAAARQADRRYPRGGRAHPPDLRRRFVGRHRRQRGGHRRACGDGVGRRAGGRAHRGGAALPQRRDSGPPGGERRCAEGAHAGHGHHGRQPHLQRAGTRARPQPGVRRLRRHRTATCCRASASPATAFTRSPS